MALIDFSHQSDQGRDGQVSGCALVNGYTEQTGDYAKSKTPVYCCPGLTRWDEGDTYTGAIRGSIWVKNQGLFALLGTQLIQFLSPGVSKVWGAIPGTGAVSMALNQRVEGQQLAIVTGSGKLYIADMGAGTLTDWSTPNDPAAPLSDGLPFTDFPAPVSVCLVANYFVYAIGDGRIFTSSLNDGTVVNPLAYDYAQVSANGIVRAVQHRGVLVVFGPRSYEIWQSAGSYPFPLAPILGSVSVGLLAADSVVEINDSLLWVDHEGRVQQVMAGYPERVSNHAVERAISGLTLEEKQALHGTVYFFEGHVFYSLSSNGNWTYEYDLTTKLWHSRETYGQGSWIGRCGCQVDDVTIMGNPVDGALYYIDGNSYLDGTALAPLTAIGQLIHEFPAGIIVDKVRVDAVRGRGTVSGDPHSDNPQLLLDFSRDGGRTWEGGFSQSLGQAGDYTLRIDYRRLGAFREPGVLLRFRCSAPVFKSLMNVEATLRKLAR